VLVGFIGMAVLVHLLFRWLAEKKIRVNKDTDEALVRAFTAQLGKDGN
jgi:hypothetical protein